MAALVALGCSPPPPPQPPISASHPPSPPPATTASAQPAAPPLSSAPPPSPPPEPPPANPKELVARGKELPFGCFAWSESAGVAACVTGRGSIQEGHRYALSFLGDTTKPIVLVEAPPHDFEDKPLIVPPNDRATVLARLEGAAFLPDPLLEIEPGGTPAGDEGGRFAVRYRRIKTGDVALMTGAWSVFNDVIEIRCGKKGAFQTLISEKIENPHVESAKVHFLKERYVLVERSVSFAFEGDVGGSTRAALFDLVKRCPRPAK